MQQQSEKMSITWLIAIEPNHIKRRKLRNEINYGSNGQKYVIKNRQNL
jgi:hypothetical protein